MIIADLRLATELIIKYKVQDKLIKSFRRSGPQWLELTNKSS